MKTTTLATTVCAFGALLTAQTEKEVYTALEHYFGADAISKPARARLKQWGATALPHIKAIANSRAGPTVDWPLVCTLGDLRSRKATELWVEIVCDKTKVPRRQGFDALVVFLDRADVRDVLTDHREFRTAIEGLRTSSSFLERGYFLDAVSKMGWEDAAPMVRKLTSDADVRVRRRAADTLKALTGETVAVARHPLVFRGRRIIKDLLGPPMTLPQTLPGQNLWADRVASFTEWFDGTPRLLLGQEKRFTDLADPKPKVIDLDRVGHGLISLRAHDRGRMFVVLVADGVHGGAEYAIGWSEDGRPLWEYKPPTAGIKDAAKLWDAGGEYGVVLGVGGRTGLVALDSAGETLWQVPRKYIVYSTRTHANLPGELLLVSGDATYLTHRRDSKRLGSRKLERTPAFGHATEGVLFPAPDGKRAAIVAGSATQNESVVARFDADGHMIWRALPPSSVEGLALLEPKGHGRLFVITTERGSILVFDADGVIRWEGELPNPKNAKNVATYFLAAGQSAPGSWTVVVRLLWGWYSFPVRLR